MLIPSALREKADVDELDFVLEWDDLLTEVGDTISTAAVTYTGEDTDLTVDTISNTSTEVQFWTRGGTRGVSYTILCTIVTVGARTIERAMRLTIK